MIKKNIWLTVALLTFIVYGLSAADTLLLSDAENSALEYSPRLKAIIFEQKAYTERASTQKTQLYPKLMLDGSYKYVTNVQEIVIPMAGAKTIKLGDNSNYSIGPLLSWTAWDFGGIDNTYKSASAAAEVKKNEAEVTRRAVLLSARAAYFQVALAGEQITLFSDALKLANAQYEDIKLNVRAGTKSLADNLKAHEEVIGRMKQLRQAQADMSYALSELSAVVGKDYTGVELESIDSMLAKFEPFSISKLNENHPSLLVFRNSAESLEYSKRAASALRWPKLQLSAKSSLDYPNTTILENFNQNTFYASLSMPLYETGASKNRINENENIKQANLSRAGQALADLKRDWDKTTSQLSNLREQNALNDISVSETEQLAKIIYKTYKTGSLSYIEVENANFKALEAKIQAARTKVQILINLAVLAGMSE